MKMTLEQLWQARYGRPPEHTPAAALATLLAHRSVRAYRREPIAASTVADALAAAQSASTSSHLQAWSVIAVRDRERLQRLAAYAGDQEHVARAPLLLVWLADWSRLRRMGSAAQQPTDGIDYLEAYTLAVIDAALAAQNAAIALEAQGLGIVYIGGLRNQPEAVARELDLPSDCFAVFGMCVGYPADTGAIKPRLPAALVLHEERYQVCTDEAAQIAAYDQRMRAFQSYQGRSDRSWSTIVLQRMRDAAALTGRHLLRPALERLGFHLR